MARLTKTAMMARVGATLTNVRWGWDGVRADGSIIFIGWNDEATRGAKGTVTECRLAKSSTPSHPGTGARERLRHLEELLASHTDGFLVLATAKDPTAKPRSIDHVDTPLYRVRIERREGGVYGVVVGVEAPSELSGHVTPL